MKRKLAKIKSVRFGYSEYLFGLTLGIGGEGWGVVGSYYYNPSYKGHEDNGMVTMMDNVQKMLKDANVETVDKLLNKPIECTFDGNILKEFRILTEVI
ncbi:MAG TPA: hypothetical protein VIK72_19405 [Clostridiaceae bacterium]